MRYDFLSDNCAPAHPKVLQRLVEVNSGFAPPYGKDKWSIAMVERLEEVFEHPLSVWLLDSGTASNCLLLSALCPPYGAVFCHEECHLIVDESSGPAFFTGGARLVGVEGEGALIDTALLAKRLEEWPQGDVESVQASCIALTQSSELGRVYQPSHLSAIADVASHFELPIFMDGARFTNGLVSTGLSPAEMSWKRGVSALTFGMTKNGTVCAEAAIVFDPRYSRHLRFLQKRAGHLTSKMRYFSAQVLAILEDDLWLDNARHANAMCTQLADRLQATGSAKTLQPLPVEANELFVAFSEEARRRLNEAGYEFYTVNAYGDPEATRLVTSWATRASDIETLVEVIEGKDD